MKTAVIACPAKEANFSVQLVATTSQLPTTLLLRLHHSTSARMVKFGSEIVSLQHPGWEKEYIQYAPLKAIVNEIVRPHCYLRSALRLHRMGCTGPVRS